jgi:hypothetical protein
LNSLQLSTMNKTTNSYFAPHSHNHPPLSLFSFFPKSKEHKFCPICQFPKFSSNPNTKQNSSTNPKPPSFSLIFAISIPFFYYFLPFSSNKRCMKTTMSLDHAYLQCFLLPLSCPSFMDIHFILFL